MIKIFVLLGVPVSVLFISNLAAPERNSFAGPSSSLQTQEMFSMSDTSLSNVPEGRDSGHRPPNWSSLDSYHSSQDEGKGKERMVLVAPRERRKAGGAFKSMKGLLLASRAADIRRRIKGERDYQRDLFSRLQSILEELDQKITATECDIHQFTSKLEHVSQTHEHGSEEGVHNNVTPEDLQEIRDRTQRRLKLLLKMRADIESNLDAKRKEKESFEERFNTEGFLQSEEGYNELLGLEKQQQNQDKVLAKFEEKLEEIEKEEKAEQGWMANRQRKNQKEMVRQEELAKLARIVEAQAKAQEEFRKEQAKFRKEQAKARKEQARTSEEAVAREKRELQETSAREKQKLQKEYKKTRAREKKEYEEAIAREKRELVETSAREKQEYEETRTQETQQLKEIGVREISRLKRALFINIEGRAREQQEYEESEAWGGLVFEAAMAKGSLEHMRAMALAELERNQLAALQHLENIQAMDQLRLTYETELQGCKATMDDIQVEHAKVLKDITENFNHLKCKLKKAENPESLVDLVKQSTGLTYRYCRSWLPWGRRAELP